MKKGTKTREKHLQLKKCSCVNKKHMKTKIKNKEK